MRAHSTREHICTETSGSTIIFNHDYARIIFGTRQRIWFRTIVILSFESHWRIDFFIAKRWWWLEKTCRWTWTRKSTLVMVTRRLRYVKLQMVTGEQSPMWIKRDSWRFLVKWRHREPCGLWNLRADAARILHYTTYVPYRDWCPFCVASRARGPLHRRVVVNKTADSLPLFQADYMFVLTVAESKTQPCIKFVETRSGTVFHVREDTRIWGLDERNSWSFWVLRFSQSSYCAMWQRDDNHRRVQKTCAREKGENSVPFRPKTSHQSNGLSKQCTDTYNYSHTYSMQQHLLPFRFQFVPLDLCSQDSQCDLTEERHTNIIWSALRMFHRSACLVNRFSRWSLTRKWEQPNSRTDGSVAAGGGETLLLMNTWWVQSSVCLSAKMSTTHTSSEVPFPRRFSWQVPRHIWLDYLSLSPQEDEDSLFIFGTHHRKNMMRILRIKKLDDLRHILEMQNFQRWQ